MPGWRALFVTGNRNAGPEKWINPLTRKETDSHIHISSTNAVGVFLCCQSPAGNKMHSTFSPGMAVEGKSSSANWQCTNCLFCFLPFKAFTQLEVIFGGFVFCFLFFQHQRAWAGNVRVTVSPVTSWSPVPESRDVRWTRAVICLLRALGFWNCLLSTSSCTSLFIQYWIAASLTSLWC